jgi:hypothetical protein
MKNYEFYLLRRPFHPDQIKTRMLESRGGDKDQAMGVPLLYIQRQDVEDRLDDVAGPGGWGRNYDAHGDRVVCNLGIQCSFEGSEGDLYTEWVWKADGAGATDIEGDKGIYTDAFKRAAAAWGVGRYLYDMKIEKLPCKKYGRSLYPTRESEEKIYEILMKDYELNSENPKVQFFRNYVRSCRNMNDLSQLMSDTKSFRDEIKESNKLAADHLRDVVISTKKLLNGKGEELNG